jgi:PTH1 family peptidyl-tRNA hydrolase
VLGLGNPGERYERTRHNLGFRVLDRLASRAAVGFDARAGSGALARTAVLERAGRIVLLAKPLTYMNRSGEAASVLCAQHAIEPARVLVVCDDADLALGRLRLRPSGSSGGHRGIGSLIEAWATDAFPRLRLGVRGEGRGAAALRDYVLAPFEAAEEEVVGELIDLAAEAVEHVLDGGVAEAMNRFNGRSAGDRGREGDAGGGRGPMLA